MPPFDDLEESAPIRRRRRATWPTTLAIGSAVVVGVGCLGCLGLIGIGAALPRSTTPAAPMIHHHGKQPGNDPYSPDCAIIRAYLKDRYGEDVEISSWGRRTIIESQVLGGHATLSARWKIPGERTKSGSFTIGAGDVVENAVISD